MVHFSASESQWPWCVPRLGLCASIYGNVFRARAVQWINLRLDAMDEEAPPRTCGGEWRLSLLRYVWYKGAANFVFRQD